MVATRWLSQRLEQDVRAEEEAELYRLESGASAEKDVDDVPRRALLALPENTEVVAEAEQQEC